MNRKVAANNIGGYFYNGELNPMNE